MRVKIIDQSTFNNGEQKQKLEETLNHLLKNETPLDLTIPIVIRDKPSFWRKIRIFLIKRSLRFFKFFYGEVTLFPRKIILYKRAFEGDFKILMHIALHEIGHYLDFDYRNQLEREKRADDFAKKFGY